jgi:hypothetical protein
VAGRLRVFLQALPPKIEHRVGHDDIKSKFGDAVRSKTETAMRNEVYCKIICHNIYRLIMAMHRLDIGAGFMAASFQKEAAD